MTTEPAIDMPAGEPAPPAATFETDAKWMNARMVIYGISAGIVGHYVTQPLTLAAVLPALGAVLTFIMTWLYGLRKLKHLHFGSRT